MLSSYEQIIPVLSTLTGFPKEEVAQILEHFELKNFQKKTTLLKSGAVATDLYLVLKGCMRMYYDKQGVDISACFFTEHMFAGAYDSFSSRRPSRYYVETVEDCQVLVINHARLQTLLSTYPKMHAFVLKILEERFVILHEWFSSHILDTPEERYLNLLTQRPDLLNRIPQHQIATFLGITPVSLSRIRNRVAKKKL
jgi:CRP-like cAMP-binding protein